MCRASILHPRAPSLHLPYHRLSYQRSGNRGAASTTRYILLPEPSKVLGTSRGVAWTPWTVRGRAVWRKRLCKLVNLLNLKARGLMQIVICLIFNFFKPKKKMQKKTRKKKSLTNPFTDQQKRFLHMWVLPLAGYSGQRDKFLVLKNAKKTTQVDGGVFTGKLITSNLWEMASFWTHWNLPTN